LAARSLPFFFSSPENEEAENFFIFKSFWKLKRRGTDDLC
jgi:hypothetical protein